MCIVFIFVHFWCIFEILGKNGAFGLFRCYFFLCHIYLVSPENVGKIMFLGSLWVLFFFSAIYMCGRFAVCSMFWLGLCLKTGFGVMLWVEDPENNRQNW